MLALRLNQDSDIFLYFEENNAIRLGRGTDGLDSGCMWGIRDKIIKSRFNAGFFKITVYSVTNENA